MIDVIRYTPTGAPGVKEHTNGELVHVRHLQRAEDRIKELEAELATARAGWQETIAKMAFQERPAYDEQQQRIAKLEAINLGLTKTLLEEESEKAKLAEALEEALHHVAISPDHVRSDFIQEIEAALAAYRKGDHP